MATMHRTMLLLASWALILAANAHAKMKVTEEEMAFDEESSALLKNAVAQLYLGRHGELIMPHLQYSGNGQIGCVNILKRSDGDYDMAEFVYPTRYYYGRMSSLGDIVYNLDAAPPPGVDGKAFVGPDKWTFLDKAGHPDFQRPDKTTVMANMFAAPVPKANSDSVCAVLYACADNSFYLFKGAEVLSPFALLLLADTEQKCMNAISPRDTKALFLTIIDGGWTSSRIVFRRNVDNSLLDREVCLPWPYLDSMGRPTIPDIPLHFRVGDYVTRSWQVYDQTGTPLYWKTAPTP